MISTAVEVAGLAALVASAFCWASVPLEVVTGLVSLGVVLLFVGVTLDDAHAAVIKVEERVTAPVAAWWVARRARRAALRDAREARASKLAVKAVTQRD